MFLYWKKDFGKKYTGMLFGIGFIWVFVFRFIVEFIKNDQSDFEADMILNMGQLLSIPFIIYGIYLIINAIKKRQ
jgi:prolipoprotein diacylglyceryltransferase